MSDSEIFDRELRRVRRDRAARMMPADTRMIDFVSDDLLDRIGALERAFDDALVLNCAATKMIVGLRGRGSRVTCADPGAEYARQHGGIQCDEDMLPFAPASFDLIVSIGLLDSVNDVPGALVLMRRALKPGGLMLCAFAGAGSLETLRAMLRATAPAEQRTHPQIDVRAGGDLLARAGFVRPVSDVDTNRLAYPNAAQLIRELRANAAANILRQRLALRRDVAAVALTDAQPITETLSIVTLTGWAPDL